MYFSATLFVLPFLAQSALAATCARKYTIQPGDICDSISAAQNVSTYQLSAINVGTIDSSCDNLVSGTTICIGYVNEDCSTTYVVRADDTCYDIATNHGSNMTILYQNNPQIDQDCSNIYVGEVLCVANQVQVPPQPNVSVLPGATIPATATAAKPTTTQYVTLTSTHVAAAVTNHPSPSSSSSSSSDNGDDDDDDLPYCDEL